MSSELRVTDYKGGKLIRLSSPFDSRAKTLDFFYSLIYLVPMLVILIVVMSDNDSFPDLIANIFTIPGLFALIGFMVSTIVFLKFFRRATAIEELYINKQELQIIQKLFPRTVVQAFDITDIYNFRFHEKAKWEPHPLSGQSFDYLGFQGQQEVIADLVSEGKISFDYRGRQYRFGKELYSWDFDQLEILLFDLTGNDLRYTDNYEEKHFSNPNKDDSHTNE